MHDPERSEQERRESRRRGVADGAPSDWSPPPEQQPPVSAEMTPNWRTEIVTASGLNTLLGIWLVVSPFALGYIAADAAWNPIVFGAVILALALIRISAPGARTAFSSAINMMVGVWLFVSAFWLATSGEAITNAWISGLLVFGLAVWSGATSPITTRTPNIPRQRRE